jgi:predicted metalloprotease with PDZ domain
MLDLEIRDATDGQRSLDDLMRSMFAHFSNDRGFATDDVERLAHRGVRAQSENRFSMFMCGTHNPWTLTVTSPWPV